MGHNKDKGASKNNRKAAKRSLKEKRQVKKTKKNEGTTPKRPL